MRLRLLIACVAVGRAAVPDTCDHRNPTCDACCPAPGGVKCVDASSAEDLDFSGRTACVCYDGDAASQTVTGSDFNDCLFVHGRLRGGEATTSSSARAALSIDAGPGNDYVELGTSASTNLDRNRVWGGEGKDMLMIWSVKNSLISSGPARRAVPARRRDRHPGSASLTVAGSACDDYIDLVDVDDSDVDAGAGDDVVNVRGQYNDLYGGDGDDILYYSGEQTTIGDFEKKTLADPFLSGDEDEALDDGTYSYSYRDRLAPYYDYYYYYYYEAGAASPSAPSPAPTAEAPEAPEAGGEAVGRPAPTTLYAAAKPTAAAGGAAPEAPRRRPSPRSPPTPATTATPRAARSSPRRRPADAEPRVVAPADGGPRRRPGGDAEAVARAVAPADGRRRRVAADPDGGGGGGGGSSDTEDMLPIFAASAAPSSSSSSPASSTSAAAACRKSRGGGGGWRRRRVSAARAVSLWDAEDDGDQGHYASSRRDTYRDTDPETEMASFDSPTKNFV
ncbi:tRNA-Phe hydroxylase [Aureococcus anophagefferens]|nr:tRNA-Phe hydroxylase [Aureococcus anophagefferens]